MDDSTACARETSTAEPSTARLDTARGLDGAELSPLEVVTFVDDDTGLTIERTLRGGRIVRERAVARNGGRQ